MTRNKTRRTSYQSGILLVVVSAFVFSTAGIFTKGVEAGAWEVIFWRGVFAALFTTFYIWWQGTLRTEYLQMGKSGLAAAIIGALATAAFITSFKLTSIANVALIWATAPLFASLIAYFWIGEKLSRSKIFFCVLAFIGVLIIVQGSFGSIHIRGDLLALFMVVAMSVFMVIYRRWPDTPAAGPAALSSILLLPVSLWFSDVFAVSSIDFLLLAAFGLAFAIASVTFGEGVKRIAAGEAALLGMLETPIAPLLAFLFFYEIPPIETFIGGSLIFAAVVAAQLQNSPEKQEA